MLQRVSAYLCHGGIAAAIICVLCVMAPGKVEARNYALLVGVSSYPNLEDRFQLEGPDNDVRLIKSVLGRMDFAPSDISVLYSTGDKRPTRDNIIAGLRDLVARSRADDFVYLYFAGHGSRQPAREGDTDEEDHLDEIFLPEDVGGWKDEIGAVEHAITDNEINELITAIRANGTFVWAVFDSCHSGTMLRSVGRIKWRKVDPSALGIPSGARNNRKRRSKLPSSFGMTAPASPPSGLVEAGKRTAQPGGFVAFYGAQSHELAPELKMPPNAASPVSHGLFTWQLAQAMMGGAGLTYRQLGDVILQKYVTQGMRATTPLIEGTHLDAPMFGRKNQPGANGSLSQNQWPVTIEGSSRRTLFVPAGELQHVGKGAVFALLENVADPDDKALGYARAVYVELFGTKLEPVAFVGKPPLDLANLPASAYARVVKPAFQFSLRVAMPLLADATTARERRVAKLVAQIAAQEKADGYGTKKRRKGLQIKWVPANDPADIHLAFSPPGTGKSSDEQRGCSANHLWFLDRTGAMICSGPRANLSFRLQRPSIDFDRNFTRALHKWLNAMGKVRNLEQMVGRFKGGRFTRKIKIRMMVRRVGETSEQVIDQASHTALKAGDSLRMEIKNRSSSPVDLTILFIDSRFGVDKIFPSRGRTNRISGKGQINERLGKITNTTLGLEGMIVIASRATPGSPVADFSFLAQKQLSRTKNVRSLGGGAKSLGGGASRSDPAATAIEDMFANAAFGGSKRGATRSLEASKKPVRTPFKSVAIKSLRWMVDKE